ncbi:MAG: hypothetical protein WBB19_17270 [Desulforhopalus sp.]
MAYTLADLDNVERAIIELATNKRTVKVVVAGDVFEFSPITLPQLRTLRNEIAAEISAADPESGISAFVVHGGKGL